ncbi:MAG: UDP-N-acetylglucosamine 1-carboxyvinyltransferase [Bdellovibrionales bacterium]|nr:UDP-N-acetylglucosamine 1-carboxyvinyltransferase [Bdellovibrionales bacterium]
MEKLKIIGGKRLEGRVAVSGAKNAALPILFATLLSQAKSRIENIPALADIQTTLKVLSALGLRANFNEDNHFIEVDGEPLHSIEAPYDLVRTMRASVLVLGPLLARRGEAKVSLPGGCAIGARPVDFHLSALEALGAHFIIESGYIHGTAPKGLKGNRMKLPFPSVGATENALMAATLAEGTSIIENAAREPEIIDLAKALRSMGAEIKGEGQSEIIIAGGSSLKGMNHSVAPDRVEAATFLCSGLITEGSVETLGISPDFLTSALDELQLMGAKIERFSNSIRASFQDPLSPISLETAPFPGFPTDMQAQFMALATQARGQSVIRESIFENRFMHVPELCRLGAKIKIQGNVARVDGPSPLTGATVMATDLRASASLIIAGLAAKGETNVRRIYHLDRGYEQIEKKLQNLGASITREFDK